MRRNLGRFGAPIVSSEAEARACLVTLGPAGLRAVLKAYRDSWREVEVSVTVGQGNGVAVMLLEVGGIGTFIPVDEAPRLAELLREFRWHTQQAAMSKLAEALETAADMWQARQGPKH